MTVLADASGAVQERFVDMPYGQSIALDGNFAVDSDGKSDYDQEDQFTSREFDATFEGTVESMPF